MPCSANTEPSRDGLLNLKYLLGQYLSERESNLLA